MDYLFPALFVLHAILSGALCENCNYDDCPRDGNNVCGFNEKQRNYSMFVSECALNVYSICHNVELKITPLKFCIRQLKTSNRRMYGDSCPLFCPGHYSPVCGMSKLRAYVYRTFTNGCYFDMLNCRGGDDNGYVQVPLNYCGRHLMKNIFKEQIVFSGLNDYRDYQEY